MVLVRMKQTADVALGVGRGLTFLRRHAHVVPEMHLALFHVDQIAKLGEIAFQMIASEFSRVTFVQVQNQFPTVRQQAFPPVFLDLNDLTFHRLTPLHFRLPQCCAFDRKHVRTNSQRLLPL